MSLLYIQYEYALEGIGLPSFWTMVYINSFTNPENSELISLLGGYSKEINGGTYEDLSIKMLIVTFFIMVKN